MLAFSIDRWSAEVSCPVPSQPVWPACLIDTPDRSSSSSSRAVQDAWDIYREELGVLPHDLILTLRNEYGGSDVDGFWISWSKGAEEGLFRAYCRAGGLTATGVDAFFCRGAVRIRRRRLGGKSVGGGRVLVIVGCTASVTVMWLMLRRRASLSIPHWLWFSSFAGVLKSVADVLKD